MSDLAARYAFYTCSREGTPIRSLPARAPGRHHMSKFLPYMLIAIVSLYLTYEYLR
jgi:hypothetical protein